MLAELDKELKGMKKSKGEDTRVENAGKKGKWRLFSGKDTGMPSVGAKNKQSEQSKGLNLNL